MHFKTLLRHSSAMVGAACLTTLIATSSYAGDSDLFGLGDLPGGSIVSAVPVVSGDGSVIAGRSSSTSGYEAFRWTQSGGMVGLGDLPGGGFDSFPFDINADGSVIVGRGLSASGYEAFRWTQSGGMVGLGDLTGGGFASEAWGVNADGSVVVGQSSSTNGTEAFRWTQSGGMVGLGDLPGGNFSSFAMGVSSDGLVVVGGGATAVTNNEAFRWTESGGMVGLGDLPGGIFNSFAEATNDDGSVIVGVGASANGSEAFRWTQSGGMVGLGFLSGGAPISHAFGVNADGSVVVGYSGSPFSLGSRAFRWKAGTGDGSGMHSVADLLTNVGVNLGTWQLENATDVSDNGKVIVGYGLNPSGNTEAWIAVVDVGFISINDFTNSLGTAGSGAISALSAVGRTLSQTGTVARQFRQQRCDGATCARTASLKWDHMRFASTDLDRLSLAEETGDSQTSLWAYGAGASTTLTDLEEDSYSGSFGVSMPLSDDWVFGLGFMAGKDDLDPRQVEGLGNTRETLGINSYLSYEPGALPLRVYGAMTTIRMEDELARYYLNGVDPVISEGKRDGMTWGASLQAGWERNLYKRASMMPYLAYEQTWISLDGYEETSGPFPAIFDKVSDTSKVSRLGLELSMPVRDTMRVYVDASWAHQYDEFNPGVSGSVPLFGSNFNLQGGAINEDWAEVELGVSGQIAKNIRLNVSMGTLLDDGDDLGYSGLIGLTITR